jgi:hypothetical protein
MPRQVGSDSQSIIDDSAALSALRLLKQELFKNDCILMNFQIKFSPSTMDITNIEIRCKDEKKVMDALSGIESAPGELDLKSHFGSKPNSYAVTAILASLNTRVQDELGLTVRGAASDNDVPTLTFLPAIVQPEPEPMPEMGMEELPGEEELPGLEEELPGEEEAMPGEEEGMPGEEEGMPEESPAEEFDWEAMGI